MGGWKDISSLLQFGTFGTGETSTYDSVFWFNNCLRIQVSWNVMMCH